MNTLSFERLVSGTAERGWARAPSPHIFKIIELVRKSVPSPSNIKPPSSSLSPSWTFVVKELCFAVREILSFAVKKSSFAVIN